MATKRRHKGEDGSYRKCADKYGCPPTETVEGKRRRPDHTKHCKAPWAYSIDKGLIGGKRVRVVITARSKPDLLAKVASEKEKQALGVTTHAATVGDWLDFWIAKVAPTKGKDGTRATTLRGYRSKIDLYLKPALGRIKLQDLTPDHIDGMHEWMRGLDKARLKGAHGKGCLSETTIRQAHMVLRSALDDALARRKITYNPAAVVKAPRADENPHDHYALEQAKGAIRAAITERELCRMVTALALGLRQGEALGLRWRDYREDADGRYIMVTEAVQRIDGKLTRTDVKSKASHRRVPIPDQMAPIFDAWQAVSTDAYIFSGPEGGPCDAKLDWKAWREVTARAELPMIPLHGARGSAASILADMGEPDWRIAEILGHSQVTTTRRYYIEGTDDSHRKAVGGLIGALLP